MDLIIDQDGNPSGNKDQSGWIIDSDEQHFAADVIEASKTTPVIVDFWAPWCGPCKTLGPMMEKLVKAAKGKVRMVKINVDENQMLAGQLRIQSIPTVYAFKDGQPVDGFMGAVPESQLKQFIDKLSAGAGSAIDDLLDQAKEMLEQGDAQGASQLYAQVLGEDPENPVAAGGIIRCLVAAGQLDQAREFADSLDDAMRAKSEVAGAVSALELKLKGGGDSAALVGKLEGDPKNQQLRIEVAEALFAEGAAEQAVDMLIEGIRQDPQWNEGAARKELLKFFEALGHADPVTVAGRRKLSSILFS